MYLKDLLGSIARFISSATWPSMLKKHSNRLTDIVFQSSNQIMNVVSLSTSPDPGSPMNAGFGQTTWTGLNSDFGGSSNHFPSETFTKASTAASSTIDTSALPGLASITGPPGSYTQPTFSPAPPQTTNAQDLLGTLSDGGNTFTMDENLFKQQIDLNAPHTVYLEETVAGLTGDLVTVDYDPNIGAHENVVSMGEGMDDLQIESGDIRDLLSQFASQQPMN